MGQTVEILRGISGSGKSTYAIAEADKRDVTIISRDWIRRLLLKEDDLSNYWQAGMDKFLEEEITKLEHGAFARALSLGKSVVIDNTNLRPQYIRQYIDIMLDFGLDQHQVSVHDFDIEVEQAYQRIAQRDAVPMAKTVVEHQYALYTDAKWDLSELWEQEQSRHQLKKWHFPPFSVVPYIPDQSKPKAILCDLDGTLSHRAILKHPQPHMRSYFDTKEYDLDDIDPFLQPVLESIMLRPKSPETPRIIFVSGRKTATRDDTLRFLDRAFYPFRLGTDYELLMRDETVDRHDGKDDPDDRVKYRVFDEYIRNNYNVLGVFDDRKRVVALWEALGLRVANMGSLNEEF